MSSFTVLTDAWPALNPEGGGEPGPKGDKGDKGDPGPVIAGIVMYTTGTTRPTARTDIMVIFTGADPGAAALEGDLWLG